MRLENLYPNFGTASYEEQAQYISSYRLRRAKELETIPTMKKSSTVKRSNHDLSEEETVIMKLLGLKKKDVIALRGLKSEEIEEENSIALLKDTTFEEEEDD